ncbi:MAG: CinA family nicotinamide mononucleotide deamidase-related protein [Chloroflexi bacterium]|nr:CinA family nicotinamide mononucleotide deamidase-related protein [Chloroflexota bacterium]
MPVAEIITIGTELLLGEIVDTNTRYLARALRDAGIDLYRTMTVGDNASRIAQTVREAIHRAEIVITTGGLGPTVDDPTRQAIAEAAGVALEFRPELWEQIVDRFKRYGRPATENNRRQAYIPFGATAIENPVGTAPAFLIGIHGSTVISLPGVPREMEQIFQNSVLPYLRSKFDLHEVISARVLHTASIGESQVDELIGDLETLGNPTVGLLAHPGQTDIRITAKAGSAEEANRMIGEVAELIRARLGDRIYGEDGTTLEQAAFQALALESRSLAVVESGLQGELLRRLGSAGQAFRGGVEFADNAGPDTLKDLVQKTRLEYRADIGLGASLHHGSGSQTLYLVLVDPDRLINQTRSYGGPPQMTLDWAINAALDFIRNKPLKF